MAEKLKLIWLTDLHLLPPGSSMSNYDAHARLERALACITDLHSDLDYCVLSGDLADKGDAASYQHLHQVFSAAGVPYLPLCGNHDLRDTLRANLSVPASDCSPFVQYAVNKEGRRIIALDTLSEGEHAGELCDRRMAWLQSELERDTRSPTLVFCHHPPARLYLPGFDEIRLRDGDRLLQLLSRFDNIRHICFGHIHRPLSGSFGQLGFSALRSTTMQAPLPYPDWQWDTFTPAQEAPDLGIVYLDADSVVIQFHPFCRAEDDLIADSPD